VLVLTWNLFHGRAKPEERRPLLGEFAARLASWQWDVALLQEVPPWWPSELAAACDAGALTAPTSRNWLLPVTRPIAERRPDLIKSWGGGANAIFVRGERATDHRVRTLRWWPERRVVHGARLARGWWVVNVHTQAHSERRAQADIAASVTATTQWAQGAPAILGGDMNTRAPVALGFAPAAGHGVDHVLVHGLEVASPGRILDRGTLSDHVPVLGEVAPRKDGAAQASLAA
jgi:endonuclease/exonuclease/phosphatase family metal-dependent hydrolase